MMKHVLCAAILAAGVSAGAMAQSAAQERAEARLAQFTPTGETRNCIATTRIRQITPVDDTRWLVEMRGGDMWLNEVGRGCFGASSAFTYLEYRVSGSQLCRGDIVRVKEQSLQIPRGSCVLSQYQQLEPVQSSADTGAR